MKKSKKKQSSYLDWIPVEVTYSPPPPIKIQYLDGLVCIQT